MKIKTIPVTPIEQNCRVIYNEESKNAVILDPGGDVEKIVAFIDSETLTPIAIWLTHSHYDHCLGVPDVKAKYDIPMYAHKAGALLRQVSNCPEPENYIDDGEVVKLDDLEFEVRFVPGHAPGHVVFYRAADSLLLAGDVIFRGSIGRTDLPGGDHNLLLEGIKNKILPLPDDTEVLCGHGPNTTLGAERASNPYLKNL